MCIRKSINPKNIGMSAQSGKKLLYQPFSSIINPSFWKQLTNVKLNHLKLDMSPVDIYGSYFCNLSESLPSLATFDCMSLNEQTALSNRSAVPLYGQFICTNMPQEFAQYDFDGFLKTNGKFIWDAICDGRALNEPEKYLSRFGLLVYADLKKYKFVYWFCFPAINFPLNVYSNEDFSGSSQCKPYKPITEVFSETCLQALRDQYDRPRSERSFDRGYFIIVHNSENIKLFPLNQFSEASKLQSEQGNSTLYFAYSDPSASKTYSGWPLRNYLCLIAVHFSLDCVKIIRIRKGKPNSISATEFHPSLIFEVNFSLDKDFGQSNLPLITGWEKNESQVLAPKSVDLSPILDPKKLVEDAVNLNLRLMKWRLLPGLNLDKIASTKCLILGCGTLGCHVARGLLAWGIKKISIVDNSKISYSNPVRQSLYEYEDCIRAEGVYKAHAAAAKLNKIHPSAEIESHVFSIPMPGHIIDDSQVPKTEMDLQLLESLIEKHDAIFLLMDTRESRWLPTVISILKQKLVINAAIGFDTFLLQRYGIRNIESLNNDQNSSKSIDNLNTKLSGVTCSNTEKLSSDKLGCYFCNDIVGPGNSTYDRTLDQQCTVSRPGVSMMVSALAVELLASIISSRLGVQTPAPLETSSNELSGSNGEDEEQSSSELGIVPHSIRGNLSRFQIYMPTSPSFDKCSACSPQVLQAYKENPFEFVLKVCSSSAHLEEIAGLKDLQNVNHDVWALDSDEEVSEIKGLETAQ